MSETFQELADIPKDFVREGTLFVRRCTKRMLQHYYPTTYRSVHTDNDSRPARIRQDQPGRGNGIFDHGLLSCSVRIEVDGS